MVVLATQTPFTRVLPGPQARATCLMIPSGCGIGAGVMACADVAANRARLAITIDLIILLLLEKRPTHKAGSNCTHFQIFPALSPEVLRWIKAAKRNESNASDQPRFGNVGFRAKIFVTDVERGTGIALDSRSSVHAQKIKAPMTGAFDVEVRVFPRRRPWRPSPAVRARSCGQAWP
jgi:hypothetical protein